jgi:hypothetical protein
MIRQVTLATALALVVAACLTDTEPAMLGSDAGADAALAPADGSGDGPAAADSGPSDDAPAPADVPSLPDVSLPDIPTPPDASDVSPLPDVKDGGASPDGVPDVLDTDVTDTGLPDGAQTPDTPVTEVCCLDTADCAESETCLNAHCLPILELPACWSHADCDCGWAECDVEPSSWCEGAEVLPNCANNNATPKSGSCVPYPPPILGGCCAEDGDCTIGEICAKVPWADIAVGVCAPAAEPGRCWADADCADGQACQGAAACPCNADCDMDYEGPGVCVVPGEACQSIDASWVQEWCGAANLVIFDGSTCTQTCPGCCECKPFCELTFATMETCQAACGSPPPSCAVFAGECDDAIPDNPWWYWDGTACQEETSCMCEGCTGTFPSLAECQGACL